MIGRLGNGVRRRMDGRGDGWANAHREELGSRYYLQDVDGVFGLEVWGANTGERLFMEYEPDNWEHRQDWVRRFAIVALFDRKVSLDRALSEHNRVSAAFYMWLCRELGARQPQQPRFFFVVGGQSPPWDLVEMDTQTGNVLSTHQLAGADFRQVWQRIGLLSLRQELARWIGGRAA